MTAPYLDTSALAKWYLNEALSDRVEEYLSALSYAWISSLTIVEMRSLLLRRKRTGELESSVVERIWSTFQEDQAVGSLVVLEVTGENMSAATRLFDRVEAPLRSLDAMHLAVAEAARASECATADRLMATAALEIGIPVREFYG